MCRWLVAAFLFAAFALLAGAGARADGDACWQFVYHAIENSAAGPHPPYISYSERGTVTVDGRVLERLNAQITYRDDGMASVDDDRWEHPFLSAVLDPGPPVLGPYGDRRPSWLRFIALEPYKVIADVHTEPQSRCVDQGDVVIDGERVAHIVFPDASRSRPALKQLWIDRKSLAFVRVMISEWVNLWQFDDEKNVPNLADYSIDVARIGVYTVLRSLNWQFTDKVYSQRSRISASYDFGGYSFETQPPRDSLFAVHR
jgi:hypothetical protein